jgi:catechol 2,3-dioxygenase-like lactoylglutathione lyase family enzyme
MPTVSVTDLHHVALAVPDLAAERHFFSGTWGLKEVAEQDGKVYFAAVGSAHPYVISLRQAEERQTDLIGFLASTTDDVDAIYAQAIALGAKAIKPPSDLLAPAGGYSARFFDIDGHAIEILCGATQREARQLMPNEAIPSGLSHIVLHSPDVPALVKFYEDALGFRVSDWIGEFMVFMRCNPAHHRIAFMRGPAALNHIAFSVNTVDDLMRGLARLTSDGVKLQWGPGRHTAGNNTFSYYVTPNGNAVEYTSDLEDVDEATWVPTTYKMHPELTDRWGTGRLINANAPHQAVLADKGLWCVPA